MQQRLMVEAMAVVKMPKQKGNDRTKRPAKYRKVPRAVAEALAKKGAESERLNIERGVQPVTAKDVSDG